jgi:hypothetical protein
MSRLFFRVCGWNGAMFILQIGYDAERILNRAQPSALGSAQERSYETLSSSKRTGGFGHCFAPTRKHLTGGKTDSTG